MNLGRIVHQGKLDASLGPSSVSIRVRVKGKAQELELIKMVNAGGVTVDIRRRRISGKDRIVVSLEIRDWGRAADLAEGLIEKGFDVESVEAKGKTLEELFSGAISEDDGGSDDARS